MTGKEIVEKAKGFKNRKYWYGAKDQVATVELAKALMAANPSTWTPEYYGAAIKMVNGKQRVCDCSGLVCRAYNIRDIGSYQIKEKYIQVDNESDYRDGMIAWKPGHVGIIEKVKGKWILHEMRSLKYGYMKTRTLDEAGIIMVLKSKDIDYDWEYTEGWHVDERGWWFATGTSKGSYCKSEVRMIEGEVYAFDAEGYMIKGILESGEKQYAFGDRGLMITSEDGSLVRPTEEELRNIAWQTITI